MSRETKMEITERRADYARSLTLFNRRKTKANQEGVDRALARLNEALDQLAKESDD